MELSTVHRIKGKEWGQVLVVGASSGLFPHRLSDDVEGERRIFHVALTRPRRQVVLLADADGALPLPGRARRPCPAHDGAAHRARARPPGARR